MTDNRLQMTDWILRESVLANGPNECAACQSREATERPKGPSTKYLFSYRPVRSSFYFHFKELLGLGPLSTAAVEYHRVDTGRRGDEQPMFSASTKAHIRYSLRHKNLAH